MVLALGSMFSCDKMNDLHQPYLDRGETVYAARVDSVKPLIGIGEQVLDIYLPRQRAVKGLVTWNLGADSLTFDFPENYTGHHRVTVPGLEEGNYTYEVYTFDANGNQSIAYEVTSNVVSQQTFDETCDILCKSAYYTEYDNFFAKVMAENSFKKASVSSAQNFGGTAWFMWDHDALPGAKVIFRYTNLQGDMEEVVVLGENIKKGWDSQTCRNAMCTPASQWKFTYQTVYENLNLRHEFTKEIDLGEEYADRYFQYSDVIIIDDYKFPIVEDDF